MSESDLRETIEDLVRQFAYQTNLDGGDGVPAYWTGGLSALEGAFAVLGWDDPHPVPEMACEWEGRQRWQSCWTVTDDGDKWLCGEHFQAARKAKEAGA